MNMLKRKNLTTTMLALGLVAGQLGVAAAESELGSPAASAAPGRNYAQMVMAALPKITMDKVKLRFEGIARKYPNGLDTIKVLEPKNLAELFKVRIDNIRPQSLSVDAEIGAARRMAVAPVSYLTNDFSLEVDERLGAISFLKNVDAMKPMEIDAASKALPQIKQMHIAKLAEIGIANDQILHQQTGFNLVQTKKLDGRDDESKKMVDGTYTQVVRGVDGVMVEGSFAKIVSMNASDVHILRMNWPKFKYHPQISKFGMKASDAVKNEIVERVGKTANGKEVSLKMAVVLRPTLFEGKTFYVPAMKVGVMPTNNEAGEIFYVDMLAQRLAEDKEEADSASSR